MLERNFDTNCPAEYSSLNDFVEFIEEEERPYTVDEIEELSFWLSCSTLKLHGMLKAQGLRCKGQAHERNVRMSGTDSPGGNRWAECKCYGGGGGDSLIGIAGHAG